jgi:hypothetical protein
MRGYDPALPRAVRGIADASGLAIETGQPRTRAPAHPRTRAPAMHIGTSRLINGAYDLLLLDAAPPA